VDGGGRVVLGTGGPIQRREEGGAIAIAPSGTISMGGEPIGQLSVVDFSKGARLRKVGDGLLEKMSGEPKPGSGRVMQGYLESSSVNSVQEMAEMINTLRLFEANQRSLRFQDEALGRAISELGR
jgi:flagellar basal-body rod protein FlgF